MKPTLHYLSVIVMLIAIGEALYLWAAQSFTLPLGLLAIVLALSALWLQGESK